MVRRALTLATLLAALVAPEAAPATTPAEAISALNDQRRLNGLPAVQRHADLDQGCEDHLDYIRANPGAPLLPLDPDRPGYTPLGAGEPGSSPVYARGFVVLLAATFNRWAPGDNPWLPLPGHLGGMFDPLTTLFGYAETEPRDGIWACMRGAGFTKPRRVTIAAVTGLRGRRGVPPAVTIRGERPLAPQEVVKIPQGVQTGPNILFYAYDADGTPLKKISHRLTTRRGKRVPDVRFVYGPGSQRARAAMHGLGSALIPRRPLKPSTTYVATVVWQATSGKRHTQRVTFTTGR